MTFSKLYIPESQKQRLMWSSNSGKTKPKNYGTGSSNLASSTSRDIERPMPSIGDPAVGSKQRRKLALSSAHVRDEAQLASRGKRKMEALRILAADALWKMEAREEGKSAGSIQMDARPWKKKARWRENCTDGAWRSDRRIIPSTKWTIFSSWENGYYSTPIVWFRRNRTPNIGFA
jgi:hypothetical protein